MPTNDQLSRFSLMAPQLDLQSFPPLNEMAMASSLQRLSDCPLSWFESNSPQIVHDPLNQIQSLGDLLPERIWLLGA